MQLDLYQKWTNKMDKYIQNDLMKGIYLAFLSCLKLEANILRQLEFAFEGDTFEAYLNLCLQPLPREYPIPKNRKGSLSNTSCEKA